MFVTAQIQQQPRTAQHQPLIITHTAFVTFNKSASRSTLYMWRVTHLLSRYLVYLSYIIASHQLCRSLFRIVRGAWLGQKWSELMFLSLWPFFSVVVTDPHLLHHFYLLSAQLPDRGHTFTSPKCGSLQKKVYWRLPSSSLIVDPLIIYWGFSFHWCFPDTSPAVPWSGCRQHSPVWEGEKDIMSLNVWLVANITTDYTESSMI